MALVYEYKNDNIKCLSLLNEAVELAKKYKLKEDVNRCQLSIANFHQKLKNFENAKFYFEEAIKSAKECKNKINLCEAFASKAIVLIYLKDFDGARHLFKKAFYTRSPVEDDIIKARKCYKKMRKIVEIMKQVNQTTDDNTLSLLYDKLGDIFVELKCFSVAIDYYKKELETAQKMGKGQNDIAIIYISLGQTYMDNDQLDQALDCFYKELDCRQGMIEETVKTLLKITELKILLEKDVQEIIGEYEFALNKCAEAKSNSLKRMVLQDYKSYLKDLPEFKHKLNEINKLLLNLEKDKQDKNEDKKEEEEEEEDNEDQEVVSESDISELTDNSEDEEVNEEINSGHVLRTRRQAKKTEFKLNEKGETPLHRACIENKFAVVKKLVERGHPINPRDNAGWLPIHEAANHGFAEITEYLIKQGAHLNDRGGQLCNGTTPLHDACTNGHLDVIRILIRNGANVTVRDDDCNTPLDCFQSYHERENLTELEESDYQLLLDELKTAMKKSGFDFNFRPLKRSRSPNLGQCLIKTNRRTDYRSSSSSPPCKISSIIDEDEKSEDEATLARREYRAAISNLRRNYDFNQDMVESKPKISSLLNEEENVVEDWLEEDVEFCDQRKRPYYDLYEMKSLPSAKAQQFNSKSYKHQSKSNKCSKQAKVDLDNKNNAENNINKEERLNHNTNNDHFLIDNAHDDPYFPAYHLGNECESNEATCFHKEVNLAISLPHSHQKMPSQCSTSSVSSSTSVTYSEQKEKLLINVHIDDKILLITVPGRNTIVSWLAEQTVSRYYQMKQMKPVISLKTKEGALLSLDDYIVDVAIDNKIYATIDSWDLEPLSKRYEEQCKLASIKPLDDLLFELKIAENNGCLKLANINLSFAQLHPLLNALKHQDNLKWLDISFSNILFLDPENQFIHLLATFKKLEKLSLKGTGFDKAKLDLISKLDLNLEKLNLSYNQLDDSCLSPLLDLLSNCANLTKVNLKFNNFVNTSQVNLLLTQASVTSYSHQVKVIVEND